MRTAPGYGLLDGESIQRRYDRDKFALRCQRLYADKWPLRSRPFLVPEDCGQSGSYSSVTTLSQPEHGAHKRPKLNRPYTPQKGHLLRTARLPHPLYAFPASITSRSAKLVSSRVTPGSRDRLVLVQPPIVINPCHPRHQHVVVLPRHQVAAHNLPAPPHRRLKRAQHRRRLPLQRYADVHRHPFTQQPVVHQRAIAADRPSRSPAPESAVTPPKPTAPPPRPPRSSWPWRVAPIPVTVPNNDEGGGWPRSP